jgi:hypothetical protein
MSPLNPRVVPCWLLVAAGLVTGPGCGGGGPAAATGGAPAIPTPTPQSLAALDGVWRGASAQGLAISFTVQNERVVSLSAQWVGQGPGGACTNATFHTMNVQIFAGGSGGALARFSHTQVDLPFFQGMFASPTAASGTFRVLLAPPGGDCSSDTIAWTASK